MKKSLYLLALIIIIATVLRLYQLGNVPISPDWDEVSLGYNAYSILHTGKDEYGRFLPISLESTGDFKPPFYAYITIPSIALFGLNIFAVRLPSAIIGILAVLATYFLVKELFKKDSIALLSAFFLAISPWHLQFSRAAIEANVGDAFTIFFVLAFIKGLKTHKYLFITVIYASLNFYVYQSEKIFTPLLVLLLFMIYRKQIFLLPKKILAMMCLVGCLIILPMLIFLVSNHNGFARFKSVNIFANSAQLLQQNSQELLRDQQNNDFIGEIIDNRRFVFIDTILANYASHFDMNWLFIKGDFTTRHQAPQIGHLYLWDCIFVFFGIYVLLFTKIDRKIKYLLFGWFLLAPIPASLTREVPHAIRTIHFLPIFQIFIAIGVMASVDWVKASRYKKLFMGYAAIVIVLLITNVSFYLDHYFVQYNYFSSQEWQYGYAELVSFLDKNEDNYEKIIVSNKVPLEQSYIFFLFYLKYPPYLYQKISQPIGHYTQDHAYKKFVFKNINEEDIIKSNNKYLYITGYYDISSTVHIVKIIKFLNGEPAIKIIEGGQ